MKITILNNDFRVYWKGRLKFLHQYFAEKNIEFTAAEFFGKGTAYDFDQYNNEHAWWNCLFPDHSSNDLSKNTIKNITFDFLDKVNPDIVIAPSIVFFAGALGMQWAKKNKKKFVMFDDIKPIQVKRNFFVQTIKNLIMKQSDALWVPDVDYDMAYDKMLGKPMTYFHGLSCIDNSLFYYKENKPLNNKSILCVARLVPVKNLDNLLKAWKIVEQSNTGYQLNIIGSGQQHDYLQSIHASLNLNSVSFLGNVDNAGIAKHYYYSDALILPSLSETWGLVVNEAMAAGLPILLSNKVNAISSLLKENFNGYSFAPLDINGMANTILRYIELDTDKKQKMSAASLKMIEAMDYQNMGHSLYNGLSKIAGSRFKKPGLFNSTIINAWDGRYNTLGWDKI
ncbi:glycosyltransferase family 4 protein [Inquilinus sp. KBS0705]|nr:glycosyltransferase family 4 protein [Inquilinus sp. KBS0705]